METMTIAQGMMHGSQGGWGGPGPLIFLPFLFLFWALFLGLLAWAAFRFLPRLRESGGWPGGRRNSAEEILRERFARGEMSAEEYERAMTTLRQDRARGYDDYVREAEERLNPERGAGS
jgi:putative membrane protein